MQPQLVQNGGMPIGDTDPIFYGCKPNFIRFAIGDARFDPAARHPQRKTTWTVISPCRFQLLFVSHLGNGQPTKFTTPDNQDFVQETTLLKIF